MGAGSWMEGLCVFQCVFGCKMLVSDQIQEIAAAYVSCHTVRDRQRWKEGMLRVSKRIEALSMKEIQHVDNSHSGHLCVMTGMDDW